jgi:hypothetical protein
VVMANELSERDKQISLLKSKEEHAAQTLQERDTMFKQDAMVRMQMGKRLEQVLMDKEELQEQLDLLKVLYFSSTVASRRYHMFSLLCIIFSSSRVPHRTSLRILGSPRELDRRWAMNKRRDILRALER